MKNIAKIATVSTFLTLGNAEAKEISIQTHDNLQNLAKNITMQNTVKKTNDVLAYDYNDAIIRTNSAARTDVLPNVSTDTNSREKLNNHILTTKPPTK